MFKCLKSYKAYRWIVWGVLGCAFLLVHFHRLALGSIKNDLMEAFNMSATTFATLSSMYFYAYAIMQIPTGILADTLGVRMTVTLGTLMAGIASVAFSFTSSIAVLFIARLLIGIGVSVVFVSMLKTVAEWFHENEFASMSGLTAFTGNMGGILTQTPFAIMIVLITWRNSIALIGVFGIIAAGLCFFVVRNKPTDIGLPAVNNFQNNKEENDTKNILKALTNVLKNPYTWPPFLTLMGFQGAYQSFVGTWGQSYLKEAYGMDSIQASNYILLPIIGLSIGSMFFGKISDKMSTRKVPMVAVGTVYLISWLCILFFGKEKLPYQLLGLMLFIMGLSFSSVILTWACGKESNNPAYAGISTSVVNIGGFIGASFVPIFMGMIIDKYTGILPVQYLFNKAFIVCVISTVIGFISLLALKETGCKNIYDVNGLNIISKKSV